MNSFITLFQHCINFASQPYIVMAVHGVSFTILAKIIINFTNIKFTKKNWNYEKLLFIFFIIPILAIMLDNVVSISKFLMTKNLFYRSINCLAWIFSSIKFYALILFLEQLIYKKINWNWFHKFFIILECLLCSEFIISTIYAIRYNESSPFVIIFYYVTVLFSFATILFIIVKQLSNKNLPLILKQQLKTLFFYFLCPHFICILLELMPTVFFNTHRIIAFSNLEIILITASIYFCFKRIMQFRFLNLYDHVQAEPKIQIATNFKDAIEQINIASNETELNYLAQNFFHEQFQIEKHTTKLYINNTHQIPNKTQSNIESFLTTETEHQQPIDLLLKHKILVHHEIEFDEFYTQDNTLKSLLNFLNSIESDIFLPIINNNKLLGYITVKQARTSTMYNMDQQNKMMVFAKFLAPAIYMLQQQNTYALLQETKQIKEELYEKHQEINQYKESIKQLLKDRIENHIGIIFCKGKHFAFKNQEAQNLIKINPNLEPDHATSMMLINFIYQIEKFQTVQNSYITIHDGSKLMISGMPQAQPHGGVLLIVRKPEATDLIKMHIDALKSPTERDYLLYLETTKAGQIINKLLPSNHETFLNIKIQLLQAALQKSALLLQMHPDDINPVAEIIHQLSGTQTVHIINLQPHHDMTASKIFGINPLLYPTQEQPLLEKLSNGILLIKNFELLDTITQQKLAHLMRYGIFTPVKSEQRKFSDTRIICATTHNISDLYNEGSIIAELFTELQKHHLQLPSLVTMEDTEISELIDGFMYQNIQNEKDGTVHALNYKDKNALISKRIASVFTLQQKVETLMNIKAQQAPTITEEKIGNSKAFHATTPELQLAAQLGKHALKDIALMKTLWKKLGNQTKIADLLGVNRSSVNRRCKEYNLV
ncbi:sigma 54-interacting transcriptional regulator [Candidatus Babeliales bacterium]|nr:sigma 54-interacting transcriptional regulator [Candidatus Babeliales bacterium]